MKDFPQWRFNFSGDWQEKTLGEVCDVRDGTHESPKYLKRGYPFITSKNLTENGDIDFTDINYISKDDYVAFNKRSKVDVGDILFGMIGTIGKPVLVKQSGFAIKNVALIKFPNDEVSRQYIFYYLQSENVKQQFLLQQAGGVQKFIALGFIRNLKIKLPSIEEQKEIGEYFSSLDATISAQEKELESWRLVKKSLLQKIFSRQYKFVDDAGNFYPDWQEKTLGEVCKINPKNEELPPKFQYIDLESVTSGKLTKIVILGKENAPSRAQRLLKINDVIFQMVRPYQQNNYIYKAKTDLPVVSSTGYAQLRAFDFIDPQFLYHSLHTENFKNQVLFRCVGGAYPAINATDLSEITLKIPCIEEQKKIGKYLSELDNIIAASERILNGLKEMKRGLLQKLFM